MLDTSPFEEISITELCKQADISRITFYTHYSDKYALVDDIFQDMIQIGTDHYKKLQKENNPNQDYVKSYGNVLHAILDLYYDYYEFFGHTRPDKNPYLAFSFYNYVLRTVEKHTDKASRARHFKYTPRKIAGFLCYGMVGFMNESHTENTPLPEIREEAEQLLSALLTSDVLTGGNDTLL